MAYQIIRRTDGALTTAVTGTPVTATGAESDILIYNDTEAAVKVDVLSGTASQGVLTIDKKSAMLMNNVAAGTITLSGGTTHRTSAHANGRVYFANVGTVDQPDVPTDHEDDS